MIASEPLPHFIDDLLGYLREAHPTYATLDGVHTHDDLLEDFSVHAIEGEAHALAGYLRRVDEINPKIARGQSPAAQRDAGNRPLCHYAQAWLDGMSGQVKPRVLADYQANYRRYVADALGDRAVASITAADVRRWRADLMAPRPRPAHARPKGTADADVERMTLSQSTVKHAFTPRCAGFSTWR